MWRGYKNRKCGADSVYLQEGCGRTCTAINDDIPHTWIVWGMHEVCNSHIAKQEMSAILRPVVLKTSTFSCKDKSENTFVKICLLKCFSITKIGKNIELACWRAHFYNNFPSLAFVERRNMLCAVRKCEKYCFRAVFYRKFLVYLQIFCERIKIRNQIWRIVSRECGRRWWS